MEYKKGKILYHVSFEDDLKIIIEEYMVSTVNKNGAYAILKNNYTWINKAAKGKTFSKTINMGWAADISWCRKHAAYGNQFYDLYSTKLQALQAKLKSDLRWLDDEEIPIYKKKLEAAIKRIRKSK